MSYTTIKAVWPNEKHENLEEYDDPDWSDFWSVYDNPHYVD